MASSSTGLATSGATTAVVFLDLDGVLNRTRHAMQIHIEPELVARLKRIVTESGARIVLSTFWRPFAEYIAYILHRHGVNGALVVGATPGRNSIADSPSASLSRSAFDETEYTNRAAEIGAWLSANPTVNRFVILDDRACAADDTTRAHFVQTDPDVGLTDDDCVAALRILSSCEWTARA